MRKIILTLLILCLLPISINANIVNNSGSAPADSIPMPFFLLDSAGLQMIQIAAGDSVFIHVYYPSGALASTTTLLGNNSAITATTALSTYRYNLQLQVAAIDGTPVDGVYSYIVTVWDIDLDIPTAHKGFFQLYQSNDYDATLDSTANAIADANKGNFKATGYSTLTESNNIGINWADITNQTTTVGLTNTTIGTVTSVSGDSYTQDVNVVSMDPGAIESGDFANGAIDAPAIAPNAIGESEVADGAITVAKAPRFAEFDTLKYHGSYGMGVWVDINAANTNTSIGTDGIEANPVSTLAAARTIADALKIKRYYINGRSQFIGVNDLTVTHEEWEFIGVGADVALELDAAGVDIDGSMIENILFSGTQGGTGNIHVQHSTIGEFINADGDFHNCGLTDTITIASSDDLFLHHCHSQIAGNGRPGIKFSAGNSDLSIRMYSGGIELRNMDLNDNASIEGFGQVVVNANCTSAPITIRGMFTITDNGTTTNFTRDAVFSRQEAEAWLWAGIDTTDSKTSDMAAWFLNNIAGASLSAADIVAIADTILHRDSVGINAGGGATSFGVLLMKPAYVQGAASGLTKEDVADAVLDSMEAGQTRNFNWRSLIVSNPVGDAVQFTSTGSNGDGFQVTGHGSGNGTFSLGGATGHGGYFFSGVTSGFGLYGLSQTTGHGLAGIGGVTSGYGFYTEERGSGTHSIKGDIEGYIDSSGGVWSTSTDATLKSLVIDNSGGVGMRIDGTSSGMIITGNSGNALTLAALSGDGIGLNIQGNGTGDGVHISSGGGATADGLDIVSLATNGNAIKLTATGTGVEITHDDLVDAMWNELQSGHSIAGSFGKYLDTEVSGVGGGSAPDSATLSRILHRVVWGTSKSAGADSSTLAERDATIAALLNDIITSTAIATDAIGADEIAGTGAREIADSVASDSALYTTDVTGLSTFDNTTDSVIVDGTEFASLDWAINLLAFIGWGEVGGEPVWAQDKPNANADTLWVGWQLAGGPPTIDTLAYQVNFHVGGTAGDPPDSVKSYLWP